ncbi:restriction endonuclease subunit S [Pseudomonas lopnurensis]|uniref:restriction endonuclease subunit S n=1 Tax=Pseudomonas lopnurensis TaxID=1477517 RepID=UPI0028A6866D|nr:restriction endonuclease subunit S [Pseudomonas lopnurensis]
MNKYIAELVEKHFDTAFAAPHGIKKLRELILTLAMQGNLVPQGPNDQPASELLKEIEAEKQQLVKEGKIKKPKPLPPVTEEEKPYALPQGWEWVRLGAISSYIQRGKGPSYVDFSTHRVVSQKCVRWYGLDLDPARYIDPESLEKYESVRFLQGGDLLWNSTGTGTIGRACLVPYDLNSTELVADSHVTIIRALNINNQFLWRWIQNPWVQAGIETSASGTTNQIELNTSTVINHLMPLPPLAEQSRIVAKIDELMVRCDELEKLRTAQQGACLTVHTATIKQLLNIAEPDQHQRAQAFLAEHFGELYTVKENVAELRKAILQLAVMGKLVPQDPSDQPASELLKEIEAEKQWLVEEGKIKRPKPLPPVTEEEKTYALPQGWEWVRLGEIGVWKSGSTPSRSNSAFYGGDIPWVKSGEVKQRHIRHAEETITQTALNKCSLHINDIGSILVAMYGANIGEVGILEIEAATNQAVCACKTYASFEKSYLLYLITSLKPYFLSQGAGAAQPNISREKIVGTVFPLPPLAEQRRIVATIDELMALCRFLEHQIDAATSKQAELLNALIHAQSQINTAEESQSASILKTQVIDLATYRAAIGCYAVNKLANAQYFGRTAAAKVMYLAHAHVGLELNLKPEREAAGPLDTWIYDFERQGQGKGWFEVNEKTLASGRKKTEYRCLSALSEPAAKAETLMSPRQKAEFDRLIYALADKKTEEVEIIATLFAVWNDFLIDGVQPRDEQIISDVRENWHERKARFTPVELARWLDWLRRENIIPQGLPPRTVQQPRLSLD